MPLVETQALRKAVKSLPIVQGQDGVHRIVFPPSPPSPSSSPPLLPRKTHDGPRPQRVYTGTNTASLKSLPRESMYPQLHASMRSSLVTFEKLTRDAGKSKGSQLVISLCRPYTAAATGGSASRSLIAHGTPWSACASDVESASGASSPATPGSGAARKAHRSPSAAAAADDDAAAAAAAAASSKSSSRSRQPLSIDTGGGGHLARPPTASLTSGRVSIYAPAQALRKPPASPRQGTSASMSARSPKSPSTGAQREFEEDGSAAARVQQRAPAVVRASVSAHGAPSPRVRSIRSAAAAPDDRPKSSPSAVAMHPAPLRSFAAEPSFHAAAAAAAAARRNTPVPPPKSRGSTSGGGGGGGGAPRVDSERGRGGGRVRKSNRMRPPPSLPPFPRPQARLRALPQPNHCASKCACALCART